MASQNFDSLTELCRKAEAQSDFDEIARELTRTTIEVALESKACKIPSKRTAVSKPAPYQPWFDESCHVEKRKYFMLKNHLKRKGEKTLANQVCSAFKKFLSCKKREFNKLLNTKLKSLKNICPREYWKILNGCAEGKKLKERVSLEAFFEHFQKLSETAQGQDHEPTSTPPEPDPALNANITMKELRDFIASSSNGKASGPDGIRNEFLKNLPDEALECILEFFNKILDTGIIPEDWTIGTILPLYKNKGPPEDPGNYRGITLLSCLGKLFTAILNGRITTAMKSSLGQEQAGFRAGYSTMDHVFLLHHICDYYRQKGKQLYCAFVDYSKAFDLVNRAALWCKLIGEGISGKILRVIQNMYEGAKSCVQINGCLSNFFRCNAGVRQGENLSPILFAIFLNDFKTFIAQRTAGLLDLETSMSDYNVYVKLCVLLYADDTVLLAESAEELQKSLDALAAYCKTWDLTVNLDKTNVVIFSRGKITRHPTFLYNEGEVKVVDQYTYLGVIFNYNGSYKKAIANQKEVALKAMHRLLAKIRLLHLDVDTACELFHRCVMPILLYGSEIWACAPRNVKSLDVLYKGFLKQILGVYSFTPSCMVLGETGQPPFNSLIKARQIGFWAKLVHGPTPRLSKTILPVLENLQNTPTGVNGRSFHFDWLETLHANLNSLGISHFANNQNAASPKAVVACAKGAIRRLDIHEWENEINIHDQCTNYRMFKQNWGMCAYLIKLPPKLRIPLSKFRTRCHNLPICAKRFEQQKRNQQIAPAKCPLCKANDSPDEFHYIFKCSWLESKRRKLIPPRFTSSPNALAFHDLFNSEETDVLTNLARFAKAIMNEFSYEKPPSPVRLRATHVTRSGRVSKRPDYFRDIFSV